MNNRIQELIDKKENHECPDTDAGTCTFCEDINAQIYAEQQEQKRIEALREAAIDDQVKDAMDSIHGAHGRHV